MQIFWYVALLLSNSWYHRIVGLRSPIRMLFGSDHEGITVLQNVGIYSQWQHIPEDLLVQ